MLAFRRDGNAFFITLKKKQETGKTETIEVFYTGKPRLAKRPPWDGGVQWVPDGKGNTIISTSCQGLGASVWWPCKDHMYDEPDSMLISITVPKNMMDVSNGNLRSLVENMRQPIHSTGSSKTRSITMA
jgi:aminopeptidase N